MPEQKPYVTVRGVLVSPGRRLLSAADLDRFIGELQALRSGIADAWLPDARFPQEEAEAGSRGGAGACDFCGQKHPGGVPKELEDRGHPYLVSSARGFVYEIAGTEISSEGYEAAKEAWREAHLSERVQGAPARRGTR